MDDMQQARLKNALSLWSDKLKEFELSIDESAFLDQSFSEENMRDQKTISQNQENFEGADVIFYYGIPEKPTFEKMLFWLESHPNKHIVIIEDEKIALSSFLSNPQIEPFLHRENSHLFYWKEDQELEAFITKIGWQTLFLHHQTLSSIQKKTNNSEKLKTLIKHIEHIQSGIFLVGSDYSDFGMRSFSNVFANLHKQKEIFPLQNLKDCFLKKPAIICGAGPSLDGAKEHLKRVKDRAVIFAGGSALSALSKEGICPHFGATIDKLASVERFEDANLFQIPYLYQLTSSQEIFSNITYGKNILMNGYGAYPLEELIDRKLDIFQDEKLSLGWTVTTALMKAAQYMGCDPIIVVGMDLSFQANKDYAKGVISKPHENPSRIEIGKDTYSQKDWLMAKSWVQELVKEHPLTKWINCSWGEWSEGLFHSQDFAKTIDKENLQTPPLESISDSVQKVLNEMKSSSLTQQSIDKLLDELYENIITTLEIIETRLKEIEKVLFNKEKDSLNERTSLLLEQQMIVISLLAPLWRIFEPLVLRDANAKKEVLDFVPKAIHIEMSKILFYREVLTEYSQFLEKEYGKK